MKTTMGLLMIVGIAAICGTPFSARGAGGAIAFVNVEEVFERYEKTQELNAKMERERKEKITERKAMVEEINKLKDEADLLRDEAKVKKDEVVDKRVKDLYQFEEKVKREALKRKARYQEEILEEVQKALDEIGRRGEYDAIIPYTEDELGYHSPALEITDRVVKLLNKNYKNKK